MHVLLYCGCGKLKFFCESVYCRCVSVGVKVRVTSEGILVPEELFREMVSAYVKVEQILATLETLADEEALKAIEESREEVVKGEYVECSVNELKKVFE